MKNKKSKKGKQQRFNYIILSVAAALLLIAAILAYSTYQDIFGTKTEEIVEEMHNDYYAIRSNATDYQKELYDQLTEQLNSEEAVSRDFSIKISETVVKSFVADFYTWTNKQGSYDVGGLEYIYGTNLINFNDYAKDRFYNRLSYDIKEYGSENLLEVESVEAKGAYSSYKFERNGVDMPTYYVEAKWTYKANEVFDTSEYQTVGYFNVIINENGRYEIVSYLEG